MKRTMAIPYRLLNIHIKFTDILKHFALSLILLVVSYVINGSLKYLFGQDLRICRML